MLIQICEILLSFRRCAFDLRTGIGHLILVSKRHAVGRVILAVILRVITAFRQQIVERRATIQLCISSSSISSDFISVHALAGEHTDAGGYAYRTRGDCVLEHHPVSGKAVQIGSFHDAVACTRQSLEAVLIGQDYKQIRFDFLASQGKRSCGTCP